jgi:hypothetical protein
LVWNKEELLYQRKESIVIPIHKKADKTDCRYYHGISKLSTSYKILSNILLCRLILYADEITGAHQFGFQCNRSMTDQVFCICQIMGKMWEYNGKVKLSCYAMEAPEGEKV